MVRYMASPPPKKKIQLKLSTTITLGTEESWVIESFKQESMYVLSAKKVAVVEKWPL